MYVSLQESRQNVSEKHDMQKAERKREKQTHTMGTENLPTKKADQTEGIDTTAGFTKCFPMKRRLKKLCTD